MKGGLGARSEPKLKRGLWRALAKRQELASFLTLVGETAAFGGSAGLLGSFVSLQWEQEAKGGTRTWTPTLLGFRAGSLVRPSAPLQLRKYSTWSVWPLSSPAADPCSAC